MNAPVLRLWSDCDKRGARRRYRAPIGPDRATRPVVNGSHVALAVQEFCRERGISRELLRSASKDPRVVEARSDLALKLRTEFRLSFPHIGRILRKHHTTIVHAVRRASARAEASAMETIA